MKRFLTILLTTLALTAALCVSASATSFDGAAEELSEIGMFKGTASGFALDQVPTRAQAAIMLVRLYGAESAAQNTYSSGRITCPFTDVNETAAPYVAWLVDEGLANGTSDTTFGAADPCTARAYTIFLLRALGYQDGTDFTPATAQEFAASLGLFDTSAITGTFLRDDLAALTYQALGTDMKEGGTYLLNYLIKEGYVDANAAQRTVNKIENCRALNAASNATNKGLAAGVEMELAATVSNADNSRIEQTKISGKGDIKMLMGRLPQMALDFQMEENGKSSSVKMWMRDGWVYMQDGDRSVSMEAPDMADTYQEILNLSTAKNSGASILPFLDYVEKETSGSDQVYKMELNSAFSNMLNTLVARILQESGVPEGVIGEIKLDKAAVDYTVRNNALRNASVNLSMSMGMDASLGEGEPVPMTIGLSMQMKMDITATGSAVKITYPDFSKFEEIIGGADGATSIVGTTAA